MNRVFYDEIIFQKPKTTTTTTTTTTTSSGIVTKTTTITETLFEEKTRFDTKTPFQRTSFHRQQDTKFSLNWNFIIIPFIGILFLFVVRFVMMRLNVKIFKRIKFS